MNAAPEFPQVPAAKPGFIGRERELAALDDALEKARQGQGCVVMLAGPPGIGKTSTARQLLAHATSRSMPALWGRCPEEPGAPPYWPWLQLLRGFMREPEARSVCQAIGAAGALIAGLDPSLASMLPGGRPPEPAEDPAQARFRLFDAIASLWRQAATLHPLLLVLDDLQCLDAASLKLLEHVALECADSCVVLLGTYRDDEVRREHPLSDTLASLSRLPRTRRLKLGGFSEDETARFVTASGGSPRLAATLHERTDGHPLFLAEMTRLLEETDRAKGPGNEIELQRVPAGVREVIGSRLNRLAAPCSHVLSRAAVIGRRFDYGLLCALLDDLTDEQCLAALDEARRASLVEEQVDGGTFQFTHALIRDALYDEIPVAERMRLHQRTATTLERLQAHDLQPWLPMLAHHFHASRSAGDVEKVVEYATLAARQADAMLAYEEASRLYRLALKALPRPLERARCDLLIALGEASIRSGAHDVAIDALGTAATLARKIESPEAMARAALGYELASWRTTGIGVVAAALLRNALAANPSLDSPQRARLLSALARALVYCDRADSAVALHHQAVAMARRLGDPAVLFAALSSIVPARWSNVPLALRLAAGREAMQLAQSLDKPEWAYGHLTGWHVGDLTESGDFEGAARAVAFGADSAFIEHQPYVRQVGLNCRTMLALHAGRFAEAEKLAMEGFQVSLRHDFGSGAPAVQLFVLRREQGRLQELAPVLEHFRRTVSDQLTWQPGYVVLCCELDRLDEARAGFDHLAEDGFGVRAGIDPGLGGSLVYSAEACVRLGDQARAALLYERLRRYAGSGIVFGAHVASFGSADRVLGMLATTMKRWDDAQAHFEQAIAFNQRSAAWPWLAHTHVEHARMLRERGSKGDEERAGLALDAALAISRQLGMPALERRILALQQQPGRAARARYPAGLTAREVQVLQMIAEGKTNQDIANALFRSSATVASHVRNILTKIGAANRAEAASFAARHKLLDS